MVILGISVERVLKPNIRIMTPPIFLAVVLVICSVIVFKNGLASIYSQLKKLEDVDKTLAILQEKVDVLREIQGIVLSQADISVVSLPNRNPSLIMLSQLRNLANQKEVVIVNKSSQTATSGLTELFSMQIKLNIEGQFTNLLSFANDIGKIAPLSTLEEVDIAKSAAGINSSISMSVYWGDFPTKIPAITEPIKTLTSTENDLLDQLANLTRPDLTDLQASEPSSRDNPFR